MRIALFLNGMLPVPRSRGTLTILEHSAFRWVEKEELETVDWIGADRIAAEWVKQLPILL